MPLDTFEGIYKPLDSWQTEEAVTRMPNQDNPIINHGTNVGIGLGQLGICGRAWWKIQSQ